MYLWQRPASPSWWSANEIVLRVEGGKDLAIIERPGRRRLTIEICRKARTRANELRRRFGGHVIKLRADWLKRFAREQRTEPLRIGKRLVVSNAVITATPRQRRPKGPSHITIPAGAAFGTGQHSTTAMSLRLLEQLTHKWNSGWSMVDLGTGSGILALAATRLGARRVVAIDIDPVAISTARENARLNRIAPVGFRVADVRKWRLPAFANVVTANLFSELLIEVLPKLRRAPWLVLSGMMREQEKDVITALKRHQFEIAKIRRRGKWIALLARPAAKKVAVAARQ